MTSKSKSSDGDTPVYTSDSEDGPPPLRGYLQHKDVKVNENVDDNTESTSLSLPRLDLVASKLAYVFDTFNIVCHLCVMSSLTYL